MKISKIYLSLEYGQSPKSQILSKTNFKIVNFITNSLIHKAKKLFIYLQKTFIKILILKHFDSKYYIHIKTNIEGYVIGRLLSQMTLD